MVKEFASLSLLLPLLLLLLMFAHHGHGGKENVKELMNIHGDHLSNDDEPENLNLPSHMRHMNPAVMIFFTLKDLQVGKRLPIYFAKNDPLFSPRFLTREEAESIPFSSKEIPRILEILSIPEGSPQAKAMEGTLSQCEAEALTRETKQCVSSLESMFDFVQGILGPNLQVQSTIHRTKSNTVFQNYTIIETPREFIAPKMAACHPLSYPYSVFYCHRQLWSRPFKVSLEGDNGDRIEAIAVCHEDTIEWGRNYIAFRVLGTEPGSDVCHFFAADNMMFLPK